jgi:(hydroxyamino)benzene mutase
MFLGILGLVWPRLGLTHAWLAVTFWLIVYAAFANWVAALLAAAWGTGALMPIAAGAHKAAPRRERMIVFLLVSVALCVIAACALILVGLF